MPSDFHCRLRVVGFRALGLQGFRVLGFRAVSTRGRAGVESTEARALNRMSPPPLALHPRRFLGSFKLARNNLGGFQMGQK